MRRQSVITTMVLVGLALGGASTAAEANPLLSGYGGPGQGNQAILGSALLGAPTGGGGAPGSGGSEGAAAAALSTQTKGAAGGAKGRPGAHRSAKPAGRSSTASSGAYSSASSLTDTRAVLSTPLLGVSATDLVYIIIALAALVATAAFTVRLAHRTG